MNDRKSKEESTSRKDYYYDILLGFEETIRLQIIGKILEDVESCAPEKVAELRQAMGVKKGASSQSHHAELAIQSASVHKQSEAEINYPKVFISYSWDSDSHKAWVREFATRLRTDGVDVTLDQWHTAPGDQLAEFMERSVRDNDLVLIICTPRYKDKSDNRTGGVGYEGDIMTAEVSTKRNHRKFIPILCSETWESSAPTWLSGKWYVDLRDDYDPERHYEDLLTTIHNKRPEAPPIGKPPEISKGKSSDTKLNTSNKANELYEPIKIMGVITDEVTSPRNDGTRGSSLYAIPFQLSRRPSTDWSKLFIDAWNNPPRFTTMHRPGIASVFGSKIVLDGTTVEEVEKYHRDTLILAVNQANNALEKIEAERERQRKVEEKRKQVHTDNVKNAADRLRFE